MSYIHIHDVSREYPNADGKGFFTALNHVSLDIDKGEFICLLGPSGCGKSTLLSMLAGFDQPTFGTVEIDGQPVKKPDIKRVTIFQNYGLLPWRTVEKNVELGLESLKIPKEQRYEIAMKQLQTVGLAEFADRHPSQLSGGQQQRVAIARALAVNPDILFMDEPFAALDAITRISLQDEISSICRNEHKTIIFVTHDIDEAVVLADRIVVMTPNPGQIETIIPVKLSQNLRKDRTCDDFLLIRDKVFKAFQLKPENKTEYYL